jgi:hypothetical protein
VRQQRWPVVRTNKKAGPQKTLTRDCGAARDDAPAGDGAAWSSTVGRFRCAIPLSEQREAYLRAWAARLGPAEARPGPVKVARRLVPAGSGRTVAGSGQPEGGSRGTERRVDRGKPVKERQKTRQARS